MFCSNMKLEDTKMSWLYSIFSPLLSSDLIIQAYFLLLFLFTSGKDSNKIFNLKTPKQSKKKSKSMEGH